MVLANGTFMLGPCCFQTIDYLLNPSTLTWTATGSGKADVNSEESWTLLPNGKVLTVDANNPSDLTHSELYDPATGSWSSAGSTIVQLSDTTASGGGSHEIGPAVLRPNGTVFATGGNPNTAVYNTASGTWSVGPTSPAPWTSPMPPPPSCRTATCWWIPARGFLSKVPSSSSSTAPAWLRSPGHPARPPRPPTKGACWCFPPARSCSPTARRMSSSIRRAGRYQSAWRPTITSVPSSVVPGTTSYFLSGRQLNGLSQGAMYGDDAQSATNYPLVRIINNATNHVRYAKTHNHSTMAVATGSAVVSTLFDVPADIETGPSRLEVVANGIPSAAVTIQVAGAIDYVGTFEHAGCDTLSGWAADRSRLNTAITVSIYNNGVLLTTVLASGPALTWAPSWGTTGCTASRSPRRPASRMGSRI